MSRPRKNIPGEELLSKEEIAALEKQAQDDIAKERKAKAKKLLLEELRKTAVSELEPEEAVIEYQIDLPPYASHVMIDGVQFTHGQVYQFSAKQLRSVEEIVQNAWKHEDAAFGRRNPNAYFNERRPVVSAYNPGSRNLNNHFMRV